MRTSIDLEALRRGDHSSLIVGGAEDLQQSLAEGLYYMPLFSGFAATTGGRTTVLNQSMAVFSLCREERMPPEALRFALWQDAAAALGFMDLHDEIARDPGMVGYCQMKGVAQASIERILEIRCSDRDRERVAEKRAMVREAFMTYAVGEFGDIADGPVWDHMMKSFSVTPSTFTLADEILRQ